VKQDRLPGPQSKSEPAEPELVDGLSQRALPHIPLPPLEVEHEVKSVVISDPTLDEEGPTPPLGTQPPPGLLPPALPAGARSSPPGRELPEYVRRREKTIVLDPNRPSLSAPPPALARRDSRPSPRPSQRWAWLAVLIGVCVLAFSVGALLSRWAAPAPPQVKAPEPSAKRVGVSDGGDAIESVRLSDLPVEAVPEGSGRAPVRGTGSPARAR
jgi:hypothetical protein